MGSFHHGKGTNWSNREHNNAYPADLLCAESGDLQSSLFLSFPSILEESLNWVIFWVLSLILFSKSFGWPTNFICFLCKNLKIWFITTKLHTVTPSHFYKMKKRNKCPNIWTQPLAIILGNSFCSQELIWFHCQCEDLSKIHGECVTKETVQNIFLGSWKYYYQNNEQITAKKKLKGIQKQLEIHYIEKPEHTVTQMANNVTFHLIQLFKECFHIFSLYIYFL